MERPSRLTFEPHRRTLGFMGGVVVDDGVDGAYGSLFLDDMEETDELLMMAMALHVAADHRAVEDVHRGELVVVPCRS